MKFLKILLFISLPILFISCSSKPDSLSFISSKKLPSYNQETFQQYILETKDFISKSRAFLSKKHDEEIEINSPFELKPDFNTKIKKGILLVHGLSDSPGYFKDIAQVLKNQGWYVRTILLPGHGTRPADLLLPTYEDWKGVVSHHAKLLAKEVDKLWLGGFSTGANLVTSYAMDNDEVEGLLLFSPAFYPDSKLLVFSPIYSYFENWVDIDKENNIYKYESLPTNGAVLYYESMKEVQQKLETRTYDKPVLVTFAQDDSVLKPFETFKIFQKNFTNETSKFIWYGNDLKTNDKRVITYNSFLPQKKISTFSHMNVLFSPNNKYFGENGTHIKYDNGQEDIEIPSEKSKIWFSSWGFIEEGKYHVRLTWNPYFNDLKQSLKEFYKL